LKAKFTVREPRGFNGADTATIVIDRGSGLVTVRPHRRRKVYSGSLVQLAKSVIWTAVRAELAEKKKEKAARRAARRKS
jgi:hypothetical protein